MKGVSMIASEWVKPLVRRTLPHSTRRWIRHQQKSVALAKQSFYERVVLRKQDFKNREGLLNFDFTLYANHKKPGVSALLRIKNEESKIQYCLKSIYEIFDEIVFVDNGSEDKTLEVVADFKRRKDNQGKIKIYSFPFKQARFGPEHGATPEDSVHSFTYYSNWSLSQCSCAYICKWDGDMVLRKEAREPFKQFLKQVQQGERMCWLVYGQTLYRDLKNNHYLAKGEINGEMRVFPNGLNTRFYKVDIYELLRSDPPLEERAFEPILFYELKFVDTDEFSHWSVRDIPTERKKREIENFQLIKASQAAGSRFEKLSSNFLDDQIG